MSRFTFLRRHTDSRIDPLQEALGAISERARSPSPWTARAPFPTRPRPAFSTTRSAPDADGLTTLSRSVRTRRRSRHSAFRQRQTGAASDPGPHPANGRCDPLAARSWTASRRSASPVDFVRLVPARSCARPVRSTGVLETVANWAGVFGLRVSGGAKGSASVGLAGCPNEGEQTCDLPARNPCRSRRPRRRSRHQSRRGTDLPDHVVCVRRHPARGRLFDLKVTGQHLHPDHESHPERAGEAHRGPGGRRRWTGHHPARRPPPTRS